MLHFLVVDDMPSLRQFIEGKLRELGHPKVSTAEDGSQAMDLIIEKCGSDDPINFIISDWNMPNLNGLELLKLIRESDITEIKDIPFIMVTTENERGKVLEALRYKVDNYLIKPVTQESLDQKITQAISKRHEI